jgi:hypothetical protein
MTAIIAMSGFAASPAQARLESFHSMCGFVSAAMDDPIVYPNRPGAAHLHDFFGNTTTNAASTLATLQRGGTSCDNPTDRSAYWVPALISPSGQVIVPQRISAYYIGGNLVGRMSVMPYPSGLKIVAGGDTSNFGQAGYSCTEGNPISSVPLNCGNGANLRAIIIFPSCWDGVHTDSTDHRSHMAYPNGRGCPAHYPVLVPKLGIRVKYPIGNARGYGLSSDMGMHMTNGMSLHADFFNAWDPASLAHLVACLNGTTSSSCR